MPPLLARAMLIHVTPKVNEILDDGAKVKKLERELEKARKMIEELSLSQRPSSAKFSGTDTSVDSSITKEGNGISQFGYEDMAQTRKYVMPAQSPMPKSYVMPANQKLPVDLPKMFHHGKMTTEQPMSGQEAQQYRQYHTTTHESSDSESGQVSEESLRGNNFKLDAVAEEEIARKTLWKYMHGRDYADSSTTEGDGGFSHTSSSETGSSPSTGAKKDSVNATARTEDETYDGPPASYREVSLQFGSKRSTPDTLGVDPIHEEASRLGTLDGQDGRTNTISWDTVGLNTTRPEHIGQPLRALKSLAEQNKPIPKEVTIISTSLGDGEMGMAEKLVDAQKQSHFLQAKLEASDDIIDSVFKDLERARLCIHDLVHRNVELASKMTEKRRQEVKEEYEEGEVNVEQYWLLKGSMYIGLFFFFTGGYELFMASVMLVWLILEVNIS
eukprot:scaffold22599_cov139-Cylindrotheca_fusiformis.AAC.44